MSPEERLYDAFGELLYVVAMADGIIQPEETERLQQLVARHPMGEHNRWSFNYEQAREADAQSVYQKVLNICEELGPRPEYVDLSDLLKQVAAASNGIDENEQSVITGFQRDLLARFKE